MPHEEKAIYYETYPLGIWSISKVFAIIALALGIIGTGIIHWTYLTVFLILYIFAFLFNIKFRCAVCMYYGEFCNTKFAQKARNLLKNVNPGNIRMVKFVSFVSIMIILFPAIGGILRIIQWITFPNGAIELILPILLLGLYAIVIVWPGIKAQQLFLQKYCKAT
jgi:hypothetical protein